MGAAKNAPAQRIQLVIPPQWEEAFHAPVEEPPLSNFDHLIERLELCSDRLNTLEDDYRKRLNEVLSELYRISLELIDDKEAWELFRKNDAWVGNPPPPDAERNALKYVLRWACNRSRAGQQKASFYLRALRPFIEKGTKPADVPQKIRQAGGLKKAAALKVTGSKQSLKTKPGKRDHLLPPVMTENRDDEQHVVKPSASTEVLTLIEVDLGPHLKQWAPMKLGTRFILTGVLTEMTATTKISVEKLETL